ASVIDAARARSVVLSAGAKTIVMDSATMTIARQLTDPLFEIKLENEAFSDNPDMEFDGVSLTASTIGTIVTMSRELAADSPNAAVAIENAIVKALAVKLDQLALMGTGINEPTGLNATVGVQEVDLLGTSSVDYTVLIDLWTKLALANHDTTAFLLNPRDIGNLAKMRNDLGMNYIAPDLISGIKRLHTTSIPANLGTGTDESIAFAGDFSKLLWGVRQGMQLEVSTTSGDTFKKHQVIIKCTWRGDFALEQPAAFAKAVNIANYPVESAG
ncbi:MAG: phage major capsid protein, partial [Lentimicrobium sp.]|uniref:phage major capsid protein n=1 Tax=Lentimicrobium sp. TaxID=2034841 RepID=UPI0025E719E0